MSCQECYIRFIITRRGDYKPDIALLFHDFKVMFIQLNEATNHTVHVANHSAFTALKGGFIMT